jgi:cytosine/adenosine deaminase-related metal-dependent hydrolase
MIMHSAEVHATNAQVTCNGAYQFGMDDETGSLEAGKLADLAVLDHNPLNVDPADIRNVSVEFICAPCRTQTVAGHGGPKEFIRSLKYWSGWPDLIRIALGRSSP